MTFSIPWLALVGGMLIGLSATILLVLNGRVAGISGILGGVLARPSEETRWRALFLVGLLAGGLVLLAVRPASFAVSPASLAIVLPAGLFVGFGTRLGSGCTSGHGVCGVSRFSTRSLVATAIFMVTGAIATYVVHHAFGGGR